MADALISLIGSILGNPAILAFIVGYIVIYMGTCIVKPYKICKACKRTKETHSKLFPGAFGACRACKGVGYHVRVGARILGRKL